MKTAILCSIIEKSGTKLEPRLSKVSPFFKSKRSGGPECPRKRRLNGSRVNAPFNDLV